MVGLEERAPNKFGIEFCPKFKNLINHRTETRFKFITSNKKKSFCYYYLSILQFFDVIFYALKVKINIHKKQKFKTQSKFT